MNVALANDFFEPWFLGQICLKQLILFIFSTIKETKCERMAFGDFTENFRDFTDFNIFCMPLSQQPSTFEPWLLGKKYIKKAALYCCSPNRHFFKVFQ